MAFKRSAVRSRLSPPNGSSKNREKPWKHYVFEAFLFFAELLLSPRGTLLTHIWLLIWGVQRVYSVLHHLRERDDSACATVRIFGWMPVDGKRFGKAVDRFLPDAVLHVKIMLSHIHIGVAYDALDRTRIWRCLYGFGLQLVLQQRKTNGKRTSKPWLFVWATFISRINKSAKQVGAYNLLRVCSGANYATFEKQLMIICGFIFCSLHRTAQMSRPVVLLSDIPSMIVGKSRDIRI